MTNGKTNLQLVTSEHDMTYNTDDVRIRGTKELAPPLQLMREFPCTEKASSTVYRARDEIHRIMHRGDDRLLVIVGPCSIHDYDAAIEYAKRLQALRVSLEPDLTIVMRVYFEKPRTTVGWKGFINDPNLDESFDINKGLKLSRKLLLDINEMGLAAATEYLDLISPQYFADLIAWGAIGARTTESQSHRQLASGLSCPVGFKNGTDGNMKIAVDAIKAAAALTTFCLSPRAAIRRFFRPRAMRIATSSCEAEKNQTTMRQASTPPVMNWPNPDLRSG